MSLNERSDAEMSYRRGYQAASFTIITEEIAGWTWA
jgi:hypothetical protein